MTVKRIVLKNGKYYALDSIDKGEYVRLVNIDEAIGKLRNIWGDDYDIDVSFELTEKKK